MTRLVRRPRRRALLGLLAVVFLAVYMLVREGSLVDPRSALQATTVQPPTVTTSDPNATTATPPRVRHVIGVIRMSAGRLGNDMFVYASVLGIAARNEMLPVYRGERLRAAFDRISAESSSPNEFDPTTVSQTEFSAFKYDPKYAGLRTAYAGDVICIGFFQSWKYFRDVRERVVREFTFKPEFRNEAAKFMRDAAAAGAAALAASNSSVTSAPVELLYIGVHIRRTDMTTDRKYTVADVAYLRRAVAVMTSRFPRQQIVYVVCSDDIRWARTNFDPIVTSPPTDNHGHVTGGVFPTVPPAVRPSVPTALPAPPSIRPSTSTTETSYNVTSGDVTAATTSGLSASSSGIPRPPAVVVYSEGHNTEQDLAILASCNHTIMTVGTYGWWAGYLAGGTTIYFKNFIGESSELRPWFSHEDFYPPEWIGL